MAGESTSFPVGMMGAYAPSAYQPSAHPYMPPYGGYYPPQPYITPPMHAYAPVTPHSGAAIEEMARELALQEQLQLEKEQLQRQLELERGLLAQGGVPPSFDASERPSSADSSISEVMRAGLDYGMHKSPMVTAKRDEGLSRRRQSQGPVRHEREFNLHTKVFREKDRAQFESYLPPTGVHAEPKVHDRHLKNRDNNGSMSAPVDELGHRTINGLKLAPASADRWPLKTPYSQSSSAAVSTSALSDDHKYASRRPRELEFKPYTVTDYRKMKSSLGVQAHSLGPDVDNPEFRDKTDRMKRAQKYGAKVRELHREYVPAPLVPKRNPSPEPTSRQDRAMVYARTIPKPRAVSVAE